MWISDFGLFLHDMSLNHEQRLKATRHGIKQALREKIKQWQNHAIKQLVFESRVLGTESIFWHPPKPGKQSQLFHRLH
jgi:hypothetical protein